MQYYGLYKAICDGNSYSALAKTLSSAKSTAETQKTLKRITGKDIRYAHMGQLVISANGVCYSTFIQNPGDDTEYHYSKTSSVVLAEFLLERALADDFDADRDVTLYTVGRMGDSSAGYKAVSIFKDNSMCLVGERLYVCFSFISEDGNSHIFTKTFDTAKKTWIGEAKAVLRYKGVDYDFTDESLNVIYRDKGVLPKAKGLIEMVSAWNEYNGEYYATGIAIEIANNGFIVKTKDFRVMEIVDVIPFNDNGMAEIASYIYDDRLFVACRQDYGIPYLCLGALDLKRMEWEHHYRIPDGNSRPWFCEYNGELILINTVEEQKRRYLNFSRVRVLRGWPQPFFKNQHPTDLMLTLKECGSYIATATYNGDIYFVATLNTESFGRFSLHFYDEDYVNKKLLELFK